MNPARDQILARVRQANGSATTLADASAAWPAIARGYQQTGSHQTSPASREAVLELFAERLRDYDATVAFCSPASLAETVLASLAANSVRILAIPSGFADLPAETLLRNGLEVVAADDATPVQLDTVDAILTASTLGIAETGSLVLQGVAGQGTRAATLVPDVHFCIVRAADVVATVPEALARLQATATLPTTFVSGPSATADIEMTRIKGVHGPRFLHVFVLDDLG